MKNITFRLFLLGILTLFVMTIPAYAQDKPNQLTIKAGPYFPTGDLDDADFDVGPGFEATYGYRFSPYITFEAGVGVFHTDRDNVPLIVSIPPFPGTVSTSVKEELTVATFMLYLKGSIPLDPVELYGGVGAGPHYARMEREFFGLSDENDDTVLASHIIAGLSFDITEQLSLALEGKYILTGKASLFNNDFNLNGFMVTGNLGFRF